MEHFVFKNMNENINLAKLIVLQKERLVNFFNNLPEKIFFTIKEGVVIIIQSEIGYAATEYAPVAQLDRVSDSDSEGRWFESSRAYQQKHQWTLNYEVSESTGVFSMLSDFAQELFCVGCFNTLPIETAFSFTTSAGIRITPYAKTFSISVMCATSMSRPIFFEASFGDGGQCCFCMFSCASAYAKAG